LSHSIMVKNECKAAIYKVSHLWQSFPTDATHCFIAVQAQSLLTF
jgi:hypothetical protein